MDQVLLLALILTLAMYFFCDPEPKVLVNGNDFYAFPRLDPNCERLAWIEWTHPNMPWDKAQLWVGYISEAG